MAQVWCVYDVQGDRDQGARRNFTPASLAEPESSRACLPAAIALGVNLGALAAAAAPEVSALRERTRLGESRRRYRARTGEIDPGSSRSCDGMAGSLRGLGGFVRGAPPGREYDR